MKVWVVLSKHASDTWVDSVHTSEAAANDRVAVLDETLSVYTDSWIESGDADTIWEAA